jgi:hypothetical protein
MIEIMLCNVRYNAGDPLHSTFVCVGDCGGASLSLNSQLCAHGDCVQLACAFV